MNQKSQHLQLKTNFVFQLSFMDCFAALAYQIGSGTVKARVSVFLTVQSFAWSYSKIFWTEMLEIMHRKPVYIPLGMTEKQCGLI